MIAQKKSHMSRGDRVKFAIKQKTDLPLLQVRKTRQHIYASIFNNGKELSYSTNAKNFKTEHKISSVNLRNIHCAKAVGSKIGEIAKQNNINNVVFFRGKHQYHGIIAALADAARNHIKF